MALAPHLLHCSPSTGYVPYYYTKTIVYIFKSYCNPNALEAKKQILSVCSVYITCTWLKHGCSIKHTYLAFINCLDKLSIYTANSRSDNIPPCLIPLEIVKHCEVVCLNLACYYYFCPTIK